MNIVRMNTCTDHNLRSPKKKKPMRGIFGSGDNMVRKAKECQGEGGGKGIYFFYPTRDVIY